MTRRPKHVPSVGDKLARVLFRDTVAARVLPA